MPNPIQLCSDRIRHYESRQVYGESAMLKSQMIRDLEELREAVVAMKLEHKRTQERTNKALRKLKEQGCE